MAIFGSTAARRLRADFDTCACALTFSLDFITGAAREYQVLQASEATAILGDLKSLTDR